MQFKKDCVDNMVGRPLRSDNVLLVQVGLWLKTVRLDCSYIVSIFLLPRKC